MESASHLSDLATIFLVIIPLLVFVYLMLCSLIVLSLFLISLGYHALLSQILRSSGSGGKLKGKSYQIPDGVDIEDYRYLHYYAKNQSINYETYDIGN